MKIYLDTEFNDYKGDLISMALVAEDGREWYGVRHCPDPSDWVSHHVMPVLNQEPESDYFLRLSLHDFLMGFSEICIICDWPGDIAHFAHFLEYAPGERIGPDVMRFEVRRDLPDTSSRSKVPHNALEDARSMIPARTFVTELVKAQAKMIAELKAQIAKYERELMNWPIEYENERTR